MRAVTVYPLFQVDFNVVASMGGTDSHYLTGFKSISGTISIPHWKLHRLILA